MFTRRRFLSRSAAGLSFISLSGATPSMFSQTAQQAAAAARNDRVLVVVELNGGNDGLNTVIPFENAHYYKNRPTIGIPKDQVVKVSDQIGLHPQMAPLGELFKEGQVAIVQGAGYPNPDRSHFRSMEIWHTATTDSKPATSGWLGKLLDSTALPGDEERVRGLALTSALPQACLAEHCAMPVVAQLDSFAPESNDSSAKGKLLRKLSTQSAEAGAVGFLRRQAQIVYRTAEQLKEAAARYQSTVTYPDGELGQQLRRAAQVIAADIGVRVLFASQGGYDTHAAQADSHGGLLEQLATSLSAFSRDLQGMKRADRVVTMVFSEFGRRVDENASRGTDHGAGSCVFVVGSRVKAGLYGQYPSLEKLGDGDLIFSTDFRSVYASILDEWMQCSSHGLLGKPFPKLDLFRS